MDESCGTFRLSMRSDGLPASLLRGLLRDLESAYNCVAVLQVEPAGRRLRPKEKLRIKEIASPAATEIVFCGIPSAFLILEISIEFLKKLWDQRKAYFDSERGVWVAEVGKREFKKLPGAATLGNVRFAATMAADIFSLFERIEKARSIDSFEFQFSDRSLPLK